ncbi:MAG: hypothetical protein HOP08_12840 [Cyclobacteriaceae bacterium]|nr:hypothetical protein [Cyclobacteriaceae bacterium]
MLEDFDFLIGQWKVVNTRLKNWLCDCNDWISFESHHTEVKRNAGVGNIAMHRYIEGNSLCERSVVREFDFNNQFWKIDRMDSMSALAMPALKGTFWRNKGSFLSQGIFDNREVLVWVEWTEICKNFAYWEQSFSTDNGRTWELNWMMEFYRVK